MSLPLALFHIDREYLIVHLCEQSDLHEKVFSATREDSVRILIFTLMFLSCVGVSYGASAHSQNAVVAIADANGVAMYKTPDGKTLTVTGYPAGAWVWKNIFLASVSRCTSGIAHVAELRDPKFCKGVEKGHTCSHLVCDPDGEYP